MFMISRPLYNYSVSEDAQGHRFELLPPSRVLSETWQTLQDTKKKKKKKSHGNRKEQRQRRKLNRNDLHNQNGGHAASSSSKNETKLVKKRKRTPINNDEMNMNRSFSQLSLSKKSSSNHSKTKILNEETCPSVENDERSEMIKHIEKFKPHYLRVSDRIFKEMLLNATSDGDKLKRCLNTDEKIEYVKQLTEVKNNVDYLNLKLQLWKEYYNINMKCNVSTHKRSITFAKLHRTCCRYGFSKEKIEQQLTIVTEEYQKAANELQQYLIRVHQDVPHWQPFIDETVLCNAIVQLVAYAQRRLREEFHYKALILSYNVKDHSLIEKFYDLKPTKDQIDIARKIWALTADMLKIKQKQEILRKRIYLKRLPMDYDRLIDRSLDFIQPILSNPILNKDCCASLTSNYSKLITQHKFELMTSHLTAMQALMRDQQKLIDDLENDLAKTCSPLFLQIINDRLQLMRERHGIYLKHKVNTFFDEAPATSNK